MAIRVLCLSCLLLVTAITQAADQSSVGITSTNIGSATKGDIADAATALSPTDLQVAQMWGLSQEEMKRALVLLKGPRGAFSGSNLSPVEALGIHARSDQERRYYAQLYARAFVADVERVLAWSSVADAEVRRLVGDKPVLSFAGVPPAQVNAAVAAGARIPLSAIQPPTSAAMKGAR